MRGLGGDVVFETAWGAEGEYEAAGIWARATARRDQLSSVAPVEEKLLGIRQALAGGGASLHLARGAGSVVGFCLLISEGETLEVRYLATDPELWGSGAGRALLAHVQEYARHEGHRRGKLWVIADNARAISAYERAGWQATDDVEERGSSGRLERRFVRNFDSTTPGAGA